MSSKSKPKSYTPEFKESAVKLASQSDTSIASVARDLGVNENTLYTWVIKYGNNGADKAKASNESSEHLYDEIKRLKRENSKLKEEQAILKKAAAYFAKETL